MNKFTMVGMGVLCLCNITQGALYNGNGNTSFGGVIGTGSLTLSDNGSIVTGTINKGSGDFTDILVIFIDSKAGGFSTTTDFTDSSGILTRGVSGIDGTGNRSVADFAAGFSADYAIALRPRSVAESQQLFQLANNGSHTALGSVNLDPLSTQTSSTYTFSFNVADIGLTAGSGASFKFESTYIAGSGIRSLESFESLTGEQGWLSVSFDSFNTYTLAPVPETTTVSLAIFGIFILVSGIYNHVKSRLRQI
jgi:hypothetical protein